MPWHTSPLRIVLDPGGPDELLLLDWGEQFEMFELPWRQQTAMRNGLRGTHGVPLALGNVGRRIAFARKRPAASLIERWVDLLDADAALPIRKRLALHWRVSAEAWPAGAETPEIGSEDETTATLAHYIAPFSVLEDVTRIPHGIHQAVVHRYAVLMGALNKQAAS